MMVSFAGIYFLYDGKEITKKCQVNLIETVYFAFHKLIYNLLTRIEDIGILFGGEGVYDERVSEC